MFQKFDEAMQKKMKNCSDDGYIRDKPNTDHWADIIDKDSDFCKGFEHIYNNYEIPEVDNEDYTPDFLDNTYLNMEVALPRIGQGLELARVVKRLQDKYGIPIETTNDNPILDS